MIPFRPTEERVWRSMHTLLADHLDPSKYEVHVDYAILADLTHMSPFELAAAGPNLRTILGIPIVADHRLRRGAVVLRHEVEA